MAKGLCERCYDVVRYHADLNLSHAKRKKNRLAKDVVAKRYPKVRAWHNKNKHKVKAYKRKWHEENGPKPKWPLGMTVWTKWSGFWCQGEIIVVQTHPHRIKVRLLGGTEFWTTGQYCKAEKPLEAVK